jgi:hypothetical protein
VPPGLQDLAQYVDESEDIGSFVAPSLCRAHDGRRHRRARRRHDIPPNPAGGDIPRRDPWIENIETAALKPGVTRET